jgi:hypothetical protein
MQIAFYEAFAFNPATCEYDRWVGTAPPLATIEMHGFKADLTYPLYADKKLMDADGWAFRAPIGAPSR